MPRRGRPEVPSLGPGLQSVEEGKAASRTCARSHLRGRDEEPGDLA